MKKVLLPASLFFLAFFGPAIAQTIGIVNNATPTVGFTTGQCVTIKSDGTTTGASCGGSPSGAAGGVLSGTYPNPGFATTTGTGSVVQATSPTLVTPVLGAATGSSIILAGSLTAGANNALAWTGRGFITSPVAGTIQLGSVNAASPVSQILGTQGSRPGTDSNVAGGTLTVASGIGTGNSTATKINFQSPVAVASGTGAQTLTTGLSVNVGTFVSTGYVVNALPASPGAGARAHVTDAVACTLLGALTGGGSTFCPVVFNGTAWVGG